MKRDPALQPLSRDHHQALFAAQRLRRAVELDAAVAEFAAFWAGHARRHFRAEEEVLLPRWGESPGYDPELAGRLMREHLELRVAAARLAAAPEPDRLDAAQLGEALERHVRFEERELFPAIEASLDPEALSALAAEVERAEAEG